MGRSKHISQSAFLVNESRARNVALSQDPYAKFWVSDATRRLWEEFAREVYPFDDTEIPLRNRFYLGVLEAGLFLHPDMVLINLGAGFTSYPFLTEWPCACIEVDFERVVNFKRLKTDEWKRKGLLPNRDIEFVACDLSKRIEIAALRSRLERELAGRISAAFLEGITYYLESAILSDLFALLRDIQTEESLIAFDFWTPDAAEHPVHKRFRKFFADRFGHGETKYNLFDPALLGIPDGYRLVQRTDIVELERRYSDKKQLLPPEEILPEHYAVLERTDG